MSPNAMRTVAVIQARMGSSRLPGKVLATVGGRPMLEQQLRRVGAADIDEVVVATTELPEDDSIADLAKGLGYRAVRGSRDDVLSRYALAAQATGAEVIVRITADCPLTDPDVIDRVVAALVADRSAGDYASNVVERTFPQGLDAEAFFIDTLLRMDRYARLPEDREHVTTVLRFGRPSLFAVVSVVDQENNADLRWTVDEEPDLRLIRHLFADLEISQRVVGYREILEHVRGNPELATLNAQVAARTPADNIARALR